MTPQSYEHAAAQPYRSQHNGAEYICDIFYDAILHRTFYELTTAQTHITMDSLINLAYMKIVFK